MLHELILQIEDEDLYKHGLDGCLEIIRCKDCKFFTDSHELKNYPLGECSVWNEVTYTHGYCSEGERRTNETY